MRFFGGLRPLLVMLGAVPSFTGCELSPPDLETIVNEQLIYKETDLSESALAERIREIDENFGEPRSPTKVQLSYETSLISISKVNKYEALWRGARACAWLGLNDPEKARREEYARKGILVGNEAIKRTSTKVESHYWLATCMAALSKVRGSGDLVTKIHDRIQMALALDPAYDRCGPHRFLGQLMVETADYPAWGVGSFEKGLAHLKKATEMCPDYGENLLEYGRALKKDDDPQGARRAFEKVLTCPAPKGLTAEHQSWLEEAQAEIQKL